MRFFFFHLSPEMENRLTLPKTSCLKVTVLDNASIIESRIILYIDYVCTHFIADYKIYIIGGGG